MPMYEYECGDCGRAFEEWVPTIDGDGEVRCPSCRSRRVQRKLSVFTARQGAAASPVAPGGGCGRCGDPQGPCSLD